MARIIYTDRGQDKVRYKGDRIDRDDWMELSSGGYFG